MGPVGIAQLSGEAAREGAATYFSLMAAVSLNLAIFNLLPIPILDGGVILMLLVEMLMRRDLDLQSEGSRGESRLCVPDGRGGVRDLQRHLEDASAGLKLSSCARSSALQGTKIHSRIL